MPNTTSSIKLLILDDNDEQREHLLQLFRRQGRYEATAAVNGGDALNKAAHVRFDIALLDLHLPDMSGIDVLVKLKEKQPDLEALMVTAHSSIETAVEAMRKDGHYRRVGGTQERNADVRIVAATNRDLAEEIKNGHFREDLFYRLNVVPIALPPLRERQSDIPELIEHFLTTRQVGFIRSRVEPEARKELMAYSWPGNVRELANILERAQILAKNHTITLGDLPESIVAAQPAVEEEAGDPNRLSELERRHIQDILRQEKGRKGNTAWVLGISRRALPIDPQVSTGMTPITLCQFE